MSDAGANLSLDSLLDEARRRANGRDDFGDGPFEGPLRLLLDSLEKEARLNAIGRMIARERVLGHVVNRLNYVGDRKQHPEIAREEIVRPVFIIGMPRTGTTILHDVLAQDPDTRAPLTWEAMFPSPPPEAATFASDPRIAACAATFPSVDLQIPAFKAMHPMGAELSQECVTMMGETMCTPLFHNQFRVPTYQDWVDHGADWSHVYVFHRRQLQHLQWRNRRERWVLKTGAHLWGLEHLLTTYPDARIVFTHRDPLKSMTSYASLTSLVRTMGSDQVDPHEIAADWTARLRRVLEHGVAVRGAREYPRAIFYDMQFQDFVRDPFAEIEKIYDALGLRMTAPGAQRMRAYIADHPKGKDGIHRYAPHEFGVDPAAVRRAFGCYMERFGLVPEPD
jgi:hypothetical protein